MPISELSSMSREDSYARCRERVINMYCVIGDLQDAIKWLWIDVASKQ
jgi:hypothetical protein